MKGKGRYQVRLTLGIFCAFFILPCVGYGAALTIGNTVQTTGNWTVNGTINATSFSGDGSGLTNVQGTGGPSSAIEVYDANDQFLGYSSSFPTGDSGKITSGQGSPTWTYPNLSAPSIRIPGLDKEVVFSLWGAWGSLAGGLLYYLSPDCSGPAYGAPITSYQIIGIPNFNAPPPCPTCPIPQLVYTGQETAQSVLIQSYVIPGFSCNNYGALSNPISGWFVPLTEVTLPFVIPVALPLKFKVGGTN
jgi:hypothetical protein